MLPEDVMSALQLSKKSIMIMVMIVSKSYVERGHAPPYASSTRRCGRGRDTLLTMIYFQLREVLVHAEFVGMDWDIEGRAEPPPTS